MRLKIMGIWGNALLHWFYQPRLSSTDKQISVATTNAEIAGKSREDGAPTS